MKVTFYNVTVTIEAPDAVEAYRLLGTRLGVSPFKYESDTYSDEVHSARDTCHIGEVFDEDGEDAVAICFTL